jgi:hypothetical protein
MIFSKTGTYNPYDLQHKFTGDIVFKITAPAGAKFKWVTMGASVPSGWNRSRDYTWSASSDNSSYQTVFNFTPEPPWIRHWHAFKDGSLELGNYDNVLYAKFHSGSGSDHGINKIMIHAAYEDKTSPVNDGVKITYGYSENGTDKTFAFNARGDTSVSLNVSGTVLNKWVEISNPRSSSLPVHDGSNMNRKRTGFRIDMRPNPFSTNVNIHVPLRIADFGLPIVHAGIYDIKGRLVQIIQNPKSKIQNSYTWDASKQPAGVYVLRLKVGKEFLERKMTLLK